jgi:hypothetical protein
MRRAQLIRIEAALGIKLLPGVAITGCKASPAKTVAETIELIMLSRIRQNPEVV